MYIQDYDLLHRFSFYVNKCCSKKENKKTLCVLNAFLQNKNFSILFQSLVGKGDEILEFENENDPLPSW